MDKRLFAGNLPYSTTSDSLRTIFSPYGEIVSAEVVINKLTNRSKGFGFVEYSTNPEAQAAIDALNDTEQEGRKIIVAFAKPRPDEVAPEQPAPTETPVSVDASPVVENTTEAPSVEETPVELNTNETEPAPEVAVEPVHISTEVTETEPAIPDAVSETPESTTDNKA